MHVSSEFLLQYKLLLGFAPFTVILLLFVAAVFFSYRKTVPTANILFFFSVSLLSFILCNSFEQVTTTPEATVFYAKLSYPFLMAMPVFWFLFAWQYRGKYRRIKPVYVLILFIFPVITDILVFTNELHGLIWSEIQYVQVGPLLTMRVLSHGFWFRVATLHNYFLMLNGILVILWEFFRVPKLYKKQVAWLLVGVCLPLAFNLIYLFKLVP